MTRIVVLGAGEAAAQIACDFALGGCFVTWADEHQRVATELIEQTLRMVGRHGLAGPAELERARALLAPRQEAAVQERVTLAIEVLPEDPRRKAQELGGLGRAHPEALLATTSTTVGVTSLGEAAGAVGRIVCIGYGPAPLLTPLVELIAPAATPPRLVQRVAQLLTAIGKRPVVLARETPGLVGERLRIALLRECSALVTHGVATAEQVDQIVRDSLARSWRHSGPFADAALARPDSLRALAAAVLPTLAVEPDPAGIAALTGDSDSRAPREHRENALAEDLRAERVRT